MEFCFFLSPFARVYLKNRKRYRKSVDILPEVLSSINSKKEKHIKIESDNGCQVSGELKIWDHSLFYGKLNSSTKI